MQENPFKHPDSPILHLYQRSRQKSLQNRTATRARSNSFRDFKVKAIRKAIDNQHIIQKQYNSQKQKEVKRQRQLSKYYGIDVLRIEQKIHRVSTHPQEYICKKQIEKTKNEAQRRRSSDRMSSMLNIKSVFLNCPNNQRPMSYQSNYLIAQQSRKDIQLMTSQRSNERKISIASEVQSSRPYQEANYYKKSRFVNEIIQRTQRAQDDYYNSDYMIGGRRTNQKADYYR